MKNAVKGIAFVLASVMLLSVAACSSNTPANVSSPSTEAPATTAAATAAPASSEPAATPEPTTAAAATTAAPAAAAPVDVMQPFAPYPDTITITVGRQNNAGGQFAQGQDSSNNGYLDLIKDVLNINYVVAFEADGGDYDQALMLHAASDTLPDTFGISNQARSMTLFKNLVDAGKLADLTEAYNTCIGGLDKQYLSEVDLNDLLKYMIVDGKIYGAFGGQQGYNTAVAWIRKDWLDKLGLQEPRTLDDLTKVAQAFADQKPGGQDNTIGICFNPDPNGGLFGQWFGLLPVFNAVGAYPDIWIDDGTGKAVYGGIQPQVKDALSVMANWVQSGIFSKDMLTMKNGDETRDTYVSTNACGIIFNAWWDPWVQWNGYGDASVDSDASKVWIPLLCPLNTDGQYSPKKETNIPSGQVVLSTCKYPEAIIKTMNLLDDACVYRSPQFADQYDKYIKPLEGVSDMRTCCPLVDAGLLATQNQLIDAKVINDYIATGALNLDPRISGDAPNIQGAYIWAKNNDMDKWYAMTDDEKTDDVKAYYTQEYVGNWAFNIMGNLYLDGISSGVYKEKEQIFIGTTDSMTDYWQMLFDLQNTAYMQIISGQKPLDYFDDFVSQWKQLGGDTVTSEVNAVIGK